MSYKIASHDAAMRNALHSDQDSLENNVSEVIDLGCGAPQEKEVITNWKSSSMPIDSTDMLLSATENSQDTVRS